jgi:glycosyltransferase involved in cell wall biosynthesis
MKFSIVTPTYKRPERLIRAVSSLQQQTYKNWEMVIINDSPFEKGYSSFETSINDPRIRYYKNEKNEGVNFSRNRALELLSSDSRYVIFLDDDDYLAPDTLQFFNENITINSSIRWLMTNRCLKTGESITKSALSQHEYSYAWSYLILKKIKGDATHCIETKLINQHHIRFSKYVKQAEEWFFFYQLGLHTKILYLDHNSTISDGYDHTSGLNFRRRVFSNEISSLFRITAEGHSKKAVTASFIFYIFLRLIKAGVIATIRP